MYLPAILKDYNAIPPAGGGWKWQNPLPQGNSLRGVWGSSGTNVLAVGESGTILRYNGSAWSPMTSGTTNPLYGFWGSSENNVFAVGGGGTILHNSNTTKGVY